MALRGQDRHQSRKVFTGASEVMGGGGGGGWGGEGAGVVFVFIPLNPGGFTGMPSPKGRGPGRLWVPGSSWAPGW